jgi:GT2 family glycosyltransferase
MVEALDRLRLQDGDEIMIADNSDEGVVPQLDGVRVVHATRERSSYYARNAGARAARNDWLLFVDADCVPAPDLLDAYFAEPVGERCAALGGEISPESSQRALLARYARSRNYLSQTEGLHGKSGSAAATANLLVRRTAFEAVGRFAEGIRSGGDVDLCWRLQRAGWTLEYRPAAGVMHRHRERLIPFLSQVARYAAGARWLDRRHPGCSSRWPMPRALAGAAGDAVRLGLRGEREEALFRAVDGLGLIAHNAGYLASNRARKTVK